MLSQPSLIEIPMISIIIPVHNQLKYTRMCLESIWENTHDNYEIIVIDNASNDSTASYLKRYPDLTVIHNKANLGFALAVNQGLSQARGNYLIVLNNDCLVFQGWEHSLLHAAQSKDVGIVGVMSNFVSSPQRLRVEHENLGDLPRIAQEVREKNHKLLISAVRVVALCMLIKRELILEIGGFDSRFGLGFFEDDDFCLRSILSGFKNVIARDVFVYHFGSMTFRSKKKLKNALLRENWLKFKEKWGLPPDMALVKKDYLSTLQLYNLENLEDKLFIPLS